MDTNVNVWEFFLKTTFMYYFDPFFCDTWCNKLFEFTLHICLVPHDLFAAFSQIGSLSVTWVS